MLLTLMLLLQIKGYAADAVQKQIDTLEAEREAVLVAQVELRTSFAVTLKSLDDAIAEIQAAKALLSSRDDADALSALNRQEAAFVKQRTELLDQKGNADERNFAAEIAELDRKIAALKESLKKLPRGG